MKSIFVYNPESGKGKIKKHLGYILKTLGEKYGEIEVVETEFGGHASKLAAEAIGKYDYFFVSGGDGTLNEVINGFAGAKNAPIIGYIPCGTVNDVASSLTIPKNLKAAVKNLISGDIFEHDIFRVNNHYGIYVCCAGLFTSSSYKTKRKEKKFWGKVAYFFSGAKEIFTATPVRVELITPAEKITKSCSLMLILNSRSVAGFKLNKTAKLNDGFVEVVLFPAHIKKIHLNEIAKCLEAFSMGLKNVINSPSVVYRKLDKFTLKTGDGVAINLDGEKSEEGSFEFEVINRGVKIIVPHKFCEKNG